MIKEDGQVIHFNNPKVQASIAANTFAITGHAETKRRLLDTEQYSVCITVICWCHFQIVQILDSLQCW